MGIRGCIVSLLASGRGCFSPPLPDNGHEEEGQLNRARLKPWVVQADDGGGIKKKHGFFAYN